MYETKAKKDGKCLFCPNPIKKGEDIIVFTGRGSAHKACSDNMDKLVSLLVK
jgi:hypothetical protein